jgi:hypothetical protein
MQLQQACIRTTIVCCSYFITNYYNSIELIVVHSRIGYTVVADCYVTSSAALDRISAVASKVGWCWISDEGWRVASEACRCAALDGMSSVASKVGRCWASEEGWGVASEACRRAG